MSDMTVKLADEVSVHWNTNWVAEDGWTQKSNSARFAEFEEFEVDGIALGDLDHLSDMDGNALVCGATVQIADESGYTEIDWIDPDRRACGGLRLDGTEWEESTHNVRVV